MRGRWAQARRARGFDAARRAVASGRRTTNSLPWPGPALLALTVPPCISTSRFTSVRPMPSPPWARLIERFACVNSSKTCRQHLRRDADAVVAHRRPPRCHRRAGRRAQMWPPGSVYLAALFSRLAKTCVSRTGSASTTQRLARDVDDELVAGGSRSAAGWSRPRCARVGRELDRLLAQLDLAARDARDVEQVVHQADHVVDLPLHHRRRRRRRVGLVAGSRAAGCAASCGSAPADCAARAPAWPGTRPCAGRRRAAPLPVRWWSVVSTMTATHPSVRPERSEVRHVPRLDPAHPQPLVGHLHLELDSSPARTRVMWGG